MNYPECKNRLCTFCICNIEIFLCNECFPEQKNSVGMNDLGLYLIRHRKNGLFGCTLSVYNFIKNCQILLVLFVTFGLSSLTLLY